MALQNSINLAINTTKPLSSANGGTGISNPLVNGILVGEGANPVNSVVLGNNQVLMGTGSDPVAASITSSGLAVTYSPNNINIDFNGAVRVSQGGTGEVSLTRDAIVIGNNTDPVNTVKLGANQILASNASGSPIASSIVSPNGTLALSYAGGNIDLDINNVSVAYGGTGLSNTTQNALFFGNGTSAFGQFLLAPGQFAFGSTGGAPSYGSLTSQDSSVTVTVGANSLDLSLGTVSVAHGGTGAASFPAHSLLLGNGTGALGSVALTDGQLLIGSSGNNPVAANLIAGAGIAINNTSGAISISATGMGNWVNQTAASVTLAPETAYAVNSTSLVTLTLPTNAMFGDTYEITGVGTGLFQLAQNANQTVRYGIDVTTTGTGGSIVSKNQGDSLRIVCVAAGTGFQVLSSQGYFDVL